MQSSQRRMWCREQDQRSMTRSDGTGRRRLSLVAVDLQKLANSIGGECKLGLSDLDRSNISEDSVLSWSQNCNYKLPVTACPVGASGVEDGKVHTSNE